MRCRKHRGWAAAYCAALLSAACGDRTSGSVEPSDAGSQSFRDATFASLTVGEPCEENGDCGEGLCAHALGVTGSMTPNPAPGGYCTSSCANDAECGAGAVCNGARGSGARGQCMRACRSADQCRDGYHCANMLGGPAVGGGGVSSAAGSGGASQFSSSGLAALAATSCQPLPETDRLTGLIAGAACAGDVDCAGGMCKTAINLFGGAEFPGGYCSGRCLSDEDCGEQAGCFPGLLGAAGSCYRSCDADADCGREGYRCRHPLPGLRVCVPAMQPLPDAIVGSPCSEDAQCGGGEHSCASELGAGAVPAPGGYCTQRCVEGSDCGADGVCVGGLGSIGALTPTGTCYRECSASSDCREGYSCGPRGGVGPDGRGMVARWVCGPTQPDASTGEDAGVP
jgi:hypothetical protein